MKFGAYIREMLCGLWNEFTENPRLYALFAAGPAALGALLWITHIAADPRWEEPALQLDILKLAIVILGFTHMIVVVALAAVKVSGRGPGGFSFDVDSDDDHDHKATTHHFEGELTVTKEDGELPADQRVKL